MGGAVVALDLSLHSLTGLDVVLLAALLFSVARGFLQGLISELGLLLALLVGVVVASKYAAQAGAPLARFGIGANIRAACGYAIIIAAIWIATRLVTGVLRGGATVLMLGWVDHLAGAVFGLLRGVVIVVVAGFVIVHFSVGALSTVAHDSPLIQAASPLYPTMNSLLPPNLQHGPTTP